MEQLQGQIQESILGWALEFLFCSQDFHILETNTRENPSGEDLMLEYHLMTYHSSALAIAQALSHFFNSNFMDLLEVAVSICRLMIVNIRRLCGTNFEALVLVLKIGLGRFV